MNPPLSPLFSLLARSWHLTSDISHFFRSQEHNDCFTISLLLSKKDKNHVAHLNIKHDPIQTVDRSRASIFSPFNPPFFLLLFFSISIPRTRPSDTSLLGNQTDLNLLLAVSDAPTTHAATHDSCCNATSTLIDESELNPKSETKAKSKRRKAKVKMPRPRLRPSKRAAAAALSVGVSARPTRQDFQVERSSSKTLSLDPHPLTSRPWPLTSGLESTKEDVSRLHHITLHRFRYIFFLAWLGYEDITTTGALNCHDHRHLYIESQHHKFRKLTSFDCLPRPDYDFFFFSLPPHPSSRL